MHGPRIAEVSRQSELVDRISSWVQKETCVNAREERKRKSNEVQIGPAMTNNIQLSPMMLNQIKSN